MTDNDLQDTLESLIDSHSLDSVLSALADVCYEKAVHVASSYADVDLADAWSKSGVKIESIADTNL